MARANVLAATHPGLAPGAANICTGRATSLLEIAAIFAQLRPGAPAPVLAPMRPGDIRHSLGARAVAAAELGFTAPTSVADGLAELVATSRT